MSLMSDVVRQLDVHADSIPIFDDDSEGEEVEPGGRDEASANRIEELICITKALSTSSSRPLLSAHRIRSLLVQSRLCTNYLLMTEADQKIDRKRAVGSEVRFEWILLIKASLQVYGLTMTMMIDHSQVFKDDLCYWDQMVNSYKTCCLYALQTSPWRFLRRCRDAIAMSPLKFRFSARSMRRMVRDPFETLRRLRRLVRNCIRPRFPVRIHNKVLSSPAMCRLEADENRALVKKLGGFSTISLGILISDCFQFQDRKNRGCNSIKGVAAVVMRSLAALQAIIGEAYNPDMTLDEFESLLMNRQDCDINIVFSERHPLDITGMCGSRLLHILNVIIPDMEERMAKHRYTCGKPPRIVRWWLPMLLGLISSTTAIRILANRHEELLQYLVECGRTVRGFWSNWVVEPGRQVLKTIRHDETSDIAIMSRDSLKADRESLERMVVDFAHDNPNFVSELGAGNAVSEADIAALRQNVTRGDLTPVLRAYERDIRRPFTGVVRGDLMRSLLIQVQKSKVDLEVAMTGIDSLLKSQELVFGLVGLTPGILVSAGVARYIYGLFGGRAWLRREKRVDQTRRVLRSMDCILTESYQDLDARVLSYEDHGRLVYEAQRLRALASRVLPADAAHDLYVDLHDLAKPNPIKVQARVLDRIRWTYGKWLT
ncbi:hypothetical protein CDD82_5422 [Ophiocordyceps australis]|uniref:Nuclear control of ATPase protein 2 n=1 Tax=Ophiocordyceps australis TaxID=1399860 RepID=A0A2C5ZW22_9HYPO|nr:hypothetical protein CDD82_5422 [Ophiocordyceps australis]